MTKQHYVPQSYLKAWCDPNCPQDHEPYVWVFDKDGEQVRKKAPKNIFHEVDIYTDLNHDGSRNLELERNFALLESQFCKLRREKLEQNKPLTGEERYYLLSFVASMINRLKTRADHWREQFQPWVDRRKEWIQQIEKSRNESKAGLNEETETEVWDLPSWMADLKFHEDILNHPIPKTFLPIFEVTLRCLYHLNMTTIITDDEVGFITSDIPVTLGFPMTNIELPSDLDLTIFGTTMPISPQRCLILSQSFPSEYRHVQIEIVNEVNRTHRFFCESKYIVRLNRKESYWFDVNA